MKSFDIDDPNILSDHCCIKLVFEFPVKSESLLDDDENFEQIKGKYVWNAESVDEYKSNLNSYTVQEKLRALNDKIMHSNDGKAINSCLTDFNGILTDVCSPYFRESKSSTNYIFNESKENPWFNEECAEKRYIFLQKLNLYRNFNNTESRAALSKARSDYKKTLRQARYNFDRQKTLRLEQAKVANAKLYWKLLKESSNIKASNININIFEMYFKAINDPADPFFQPDEEILYFYERYVQDELNIMFSELNVEISRFEVERAVQQLKLGRSGGPDLFINEFIYYGKNALLNTLFYMFNNIFKTGYFPESWSDGLIVPLHKKGSLNDVNNFRGITLLSCIGKLFTKIINNRLYEWADNYNVFIEAQAGFRKGMSTVDNVFILHGLITHMVNQGKKLYCTFIDFTKAFDYVVRDNLWYKLIKLGLRGNIMNIIKSMYSCVK